MNPLLFRKTIVAVSGLFLCVFLVVHLSVNAILLLPEETAREFYNASSTALRESLVTQVVAYVLYAAILSHVVFGLRTAFVNRRARPQRYAVSRPQASSSWASRNMGALGGLILVFLVVHLIQFWARIKLGVGEPVGQDAGGHKDVYGVARTLFDNEVVVLLYAAVSAPLAWHLHHGLASGFKSLGLYDRRGLRILARVSLVYASVVGLGFGVIPFVVYFR